MNKNIKQEKFSENDSAVIQSIKELRGDLHAHSHLSILAGETRKTYSIEQIAEYIVKYIGTKKRENGPGMEYFAFTEHVGKPTEAYQGIDQTGGQKLLQQKNIIEKMNIENRYPGLTLLQGVEANVFKGGKLDLSDEVLKEMDIVIASRHRISEDRTTEEKIATYQKLVQNPYIDILGHPEIQWDIDGYNLDIEGWEKLIASAKKYGKAIEINANQIKNYQPDSLKMMAESGVKVSFGSDLHDLKQIETGEDLGKDWEQFTKVIQMMKKAGIRKSQILNCLPLEQLRQWRKERIKKWQK